MKKVLSILALIAVIGLSTPVEAAPGGGPGGPRGGGGQRVHAGAHHGPHMAPKHHHGGAIVHVGHTPRHGHWHGYRTSYWGSTWCDYRLGCCPYPYPGIGVHIPVGGASFAVRF